MAENATKKTTTKKAAPEKEAKVEKATVETYSKEEVDNMIAKAVAEAMTKMQPQNEEPKTQSKSDDGEVILAYMGVVAPGSSVLLGTEQNPGLGYIQGSGGVRTVSKKTFFENLNDSVLRRLKDRRLVVISGLTDEERERYGINYKDGEVLPRDIYHKLFKFSEDEIAEIFSKACFQHQKLIATLFMDEYENHNPKINEPFVRRLNKISKKTDRDGMFRQIVKDFEKIAQEETDGDGTED